MKIFLDKTISINPVWVGSSNKGYMYSQSTLLGLIEQMIFEWENDKHLVG